MAKYCSIITSKSAAFCQPLLRRPRHRYVLHRYVSTISPLGNVFNNRAQNQINFDRIHKDNVGLLSIPELTDSNGFYLLQQSAVDEAAALVKEASLVQDAEHGPQRTRKLVKVFDQLSDCLCKVADMAEFVRIAHPDQQFSAAADEACMKISVLVEKLNTNIDIYNSLKHVIANGDRHPTDCIDQRVAKLFLFDFEQSGIHLPADLRERFVSLNAASLQMSQFYMDGCHQPITVPKCTLPEQLRHMFNGEDITVSGLVSGSPNPALREAAYRLYLYPDPRQESRLVDLLTTRHQIAELAGFETHAHRVLQGTIGDNPYDVNIFLESLADQIRSRADDDFATIKKVNGAAELHPWDVAYCSGLIRHEKYNLDNSYLAPYFSLGSCMDGLGMLLENLYGVKLEYVQPGYGELWSYDVHKLAVVHETEGVLGHIYCDFYERSGKPHQDCHFTIRVGRELDDGSYQNPVVVLMLNLPHPHGNTPSLLTPSMMENLFHEFGHAMHSMLGRTRYQHVAGTRCPTDFAEVPSVLMEYFASDPRVLSTFCRHWKTGDALPLEQIVKLRNAKNLFAASEMQLQVFYSILDQRLHGVHPLKGSTCDILGQVQNQYYSIPHCPNTALHLRFGHTIGYGAKYYSYLMSRAIASKIWHSCFDADPFSRTMGEKFRRKVLAHGGEKAPSDLVEDLLDEKPTMKLLVQALVEDLDKTQTNV